MSCNYRLYHQVVNEVKRNGAKFSSSLPLNTTPPSQRHQYNRALLDTIEERYELAYANLDQESMSSAKGDDVEVIERMQSLRMYLDMNSKRVEMARRLFGSRKGT